ncbi:MAG: CHAT domain-containing protein [Chitinophagaceae bacterium]
MNQHRVHWLILFFLVISNPISAQTDYSRTYDSIRVLLEKEEYEKALPLCRRIVQSDPSEINAVYYRARCLGELGDHAGAARDFAQVSWFSPQKVGYWTSACWNAILSGGYDSAIVYGEKAANLVPEDFNNYLNLGHAYFLKEDKAGATYNYMLASEYLPHHPEYLDMAHADLRLMDSLHKKWTTSSITELFDDDYSLTEKNQVSNRVLDSIYSLAVTDRDKNEARIDSLRIAFIEAQVKEPVKRYKVIRDFSFILGIHSLEKENTIQATGFLTSAIVVDTKLRDSLSLVRKQLSVSRMVAEIQLRKQDIFPQLNDAIYFAGEALRYAEEYRLTGEWLAACYLQLGLCYSGIERYDSSQYYYHRALPLVPPRQNWGPYERLLNRILVSHIEIRRFDSASYYYQILQKRSEAVQDPSEEFPFVSLNYWTGIYNAGNLREAADGCLRLLKKKTAQAGKVSYYHRLQEIAGLCYNKLGLKDSALILLQQAFDNFRVFTKTDRNAMPIGKEIFLTDEFKSGIPVARKILADQNRIAELFALTEQTKEPLLYFLLTSRCNPRETVSMETVQRELPENAAAISFVNEIDPETGYGIGFTRTNSLRGIHQRADLNKWAGQMKQYPAIERLIRNLRMNETLGKSSLLPLIYYLQVSGFRATSRGVITENKAADSSALSKDARNEMSRLLYRYYFKPYEPLFKGKEVLYVSTDLLLGYFPIESLVDEEGKYLGEKYRIIYVPSFTIMQLLRQKKYSDTSEMIVFGNPDYKSYHPELHEGKAWDYAINLNIRSWDDLPGTEKELATLAEVFPRARILQQKNISETLLKKMNGDGHLGKAGILHFALHGLTNMMAGPDDNTLIVSEPDAGKEDGFLRFWEIFNMDIRARYVFLSACETAFGTPKHDGSNTSLVTAFLGAGAGSVIGTSWKIADDASSRFIHACYTLIHQGLEFPEAMRRVRQQFIRGEMGEEYRDPYYWAPFKYYGY